MDEMDDEYLSVGIGLDEDFKDDVKEHYEESKDEGKAIHVNRVFTEVIDGFYSKAKTRGFEFFSDEPEEGGGKNKAPRPLEYFLAGFAFCQQVQYVKYAALNDLDIEDIKMDVRGYVDQRGILDIGDVDSGFKNIKYEVRIETEENIETIKDLVEKVEDVCPAHAAVRGSTDLGRKVRVNGEEI